MSVLSEVLDANEAYASDFDKSELPMPPARRFAILTCMDARLDPAKYARSLFERITPDIKSSLYVG